MILLSEGRLVNLGKRHGPSEFLSCRHRLPTKTLAQIELFAQQQGRQIREEGLRAAEIARREGGRGCTLPRSA